MPETKSTKKERNGLVLMSSKESLLDFVVKSKITNEFSFELAETTQVLLQSTVNFCRKHNVPINYETGLWSLAEKSRALLKEIEYVNSSTFNQEFPYPTERNTFQNRRRRNRT